VAQHEIFITRRLPVDLSRFEADDLSLRVFDEDRPATADEIVELASGARGLVPLVSDRVDAALLDALGDLVVVANYGVGTDNVDLEACSARGIRVTNTPDVLTDATADLTWALILAAARRLREGEALLRSGGFEGWSPTMLLGRGLRGKRLGIYGFGRIGRAVGERGRGFGMEVAYASRSDAGLAWAKRISLEELVRTSDVLALCVPLTEETRHAIAAPQLRAMKETAVLVNTARGPVVDEAALAAALKDGAIFAAGVDVYEEEPEVHPSLLECDDAVLLPHLGSATVEAREAMASLALRNAIAVVRGEEPVTPVI